jgi:hypothetical protein
MLSVLIFDLLFVTVNALLSTQIVNENIIREYCKSNYPDPVMNVTASRVLTVQGSVSSPFTIPDNTDMVIFKQCGPSPAIIARGGLGFCLDAESGWGLTDSVTETF